MSFNRRGGFDRRPDRPQRRDRPPGADRPPRRQPAGDWQPPERAPFGQRPPNRSFGPRRDDRRGDDGGMSIRLDPRRLGTLKQLAAEEGVRPGDLVRGWVEERIDAARGGSPVPAAVDIAKRLDELAERVAALEGPTPARAKKAPKPAADEEPVAAAAEAPAATEPEATEAPAAPAPAKRARRASAAPSERVGLHDEIIAVIRERGPQTSAELAQAISERGRYTPPRSGKALDAAMVSQRVSNPTYRSRFVRADGRIGLAEIEGT